jgi:mutator protein MutT
MNKPEKLPLPTRFTLRVYGFLLNMKNEVLISRERIHGMDIVKFPGGGVEFGEGPMDALIREVREELDIAIDVGELVYTTDFFVQSALDPAEQVIGIYYLVRPVNNGDLNSISLVEKSDSFRGKETTVRREWVTVTDLEEKELTFEMDRRAWQVLRSRTSD